MDKDPLPCIECRKKDECISQYKAEYESCIHLMKTGMLLKSDCIEQCREKLIEAKKIYELQKVYEDAIAILRKKLESTVPVLESLLKTKQKLQYVQSQLVFEQEKHSATRQLNAHLSDKIKQLQEENSELMKKLEESKGHMTASQQQASD